VNIVSKIILQGIFGDSLKHAYNMIVIIKFPNMEKNKNVFPVFERIKSCKIVIAIT